MAAAPPPWRQARGHHGLKVRNRPSDGVERTVASALLLVSTAESDGVFDHASLSPNNTVYTPNSQIQFSAIGVDKNGGEAALPENVTWTVADTKSGTIDANGLFTPAKNYKGDVTARLLVDGTVKGTTSVKIADVTDVFQQHVRVVGLWRYVGSRPCCQV